ncbi:MAG: DNA polymerase IV [Chloroflexi bacterium]|nr:DNA polymerase IV [Chloroflexota bacterium]MCY4246665.1 DNA polymerase IV [Chloroflexota bacterium]
MAKTRKILHLDLDAFFCSVEEQLRPELRGKAIAVGGLPGQRGVVASASYPARAYGVRSAMPMAQALRLCPHLIVVSGARGAYSDRSRKVMAILRDTAPDVEPLSIDEAFLDVTILPEPIEATARSLQRRINRELDLPCSLGGATNKLVAKTANTIGKASKPKDAPPNAIHIVPPGDEARFLSPLPVRGLWGVGPKNADVLAALGLSAIGQVAQWSEAALVARLGKLGADIWRRAQGIDRRPVRAGGAAKSISKEVTFAVDIADDAKLLLTLRRLADGVGRAARKAGLAGATIKIKLRYGNFSTRSRQTKLAYATDTDSVIYDCAEQLFWRSWTPGTPLRLIGIGLSGFAEPSRQLALWGDHQAPAQSGGFQSALDHLRDKYGETTIRRASDLRYQPNDDSRR